MNGQMGPSVRPQVSQSSMARHPSREQLIDYLMLKVSHQPQGPPRIPLDSLQQEVMDGVSVKKVLNNKFDFEDIFYWLD